MDPKNSLVTVDSGPLAALDDTARRARDYAADAHAPATKRAYRNDWADFTSWCDEHGLPSLPAAPNTIALYLAARAETLKVATLSRRLTTIAQAHRAAGLEPSTTHSSVKIVWTGIRRRHGTAQTRKAPTMTADIRAMLAALPKSTTGVRDRAILLVGFAGAFRRSELVRLDAEDVTFTAEGATILVRRSKTDQEGKGITKAIPRGTRPETCPATALRKWIETAAIYHGPVFRQIRRGGHITDARLSAQSVALIVKRYVEASGLDPARFSGHSLRAGLATQAAASGVSDHAIMRQTGHRSRAMLDRYIREGRLFADNAAAAIGL